MAKKKKICIKLNKNVPDDELIIERQWAIRDTLTTIEFLAEQYSKEQGKTWDLVRKKYPATKGKLLTFSFKDNTIKEMK